VLENVARISVRTGDHNPTVTSVRRLPAPTASDPGAVFAVKSLLRPLVAVTYMLLCVWISGESLHGPYFLVAVMTFLAAAELSDVKLERRGRLGLTPGSLPDLLVRWTLVVAFILIVLYLSGLTDRINLTPLLPWALTTPLLLWAADLSCGQILRPRRNSAGVRKAVILGLNTAGIRLKAALDADETLRIRVQGYFDERSPGRLPGGGHGLLGTRQELVSFIMRENISVLYITLPMVPRPRIMEILEGLRDSTVSIYFVPDLLTFDLIQPRFQTVGSVALVAVRESPFFGACTIAKRISDLAVAATALVLCAPILLAVAIGVRMSSRGPVLFNQKRYGLDGRKIVVKKFRSMTVTETAITQFTAVGRKDARVTRFGAFIRKTSLDELPQLFNVLDGSMSIVGPRPHPIAMNEQYRKLIPGYMLRHKIKPGITGWAQVNGCRGGDDLESMTRRIQYDLDYLRNWSLGFDALIILKTLMVVVNDKHAF
jgi:putative colanic acid biosynthesis UDP-glucose lipid carrier transferase